MLYPLIIERLKKPIETLPSFQSAIDGIDEEEYERTVELLLPLKRDYPQSALLNIHLAFALEGAKERMERSSHFTAASKTQGSKT